jgi:hypothetical protein
MEGMVNIMDVRNGGYVSALVATRKWFTGDINTKL